jgi:Uma2 family endonuclease
MTLTSSPLHSAAPYSPFDALSPLRFPTGLRLTPEPFELVCDEIREAVLELSADDRLISMTPTGGDISARNAELEYLLLRYDRRLNVLESSGGFLLPVG